MSNSRCYDRLLSAPRFRPVVGLAGVALTALLVGGATTEGPAAAASLHAPAVVAQQVAPAAGATVTAVLRTAAVPAALAPNVAPAVDLLDGTLQRLQEAAPGLDAKVLRLALQARQNAGARRLARNNDLLTVIDYSLPSTAKRLWVFDVASGKVLFNELVAHGKNTGDNFAQHFSNEDKSLETSLGLFVTGGTYTGHNGYSLQLDGLERTNDAARKRNVVMHGASYVSEEFAAAHGRIGRSWGCPAVSEAVAHQVIDTIKGGSLVFSYYPDPSWLTASPFLAASPVLDAATTALAAAR